MRTVGLCHSSVMRLEVVWLIGLVGKVLGQVRWGHAGQGGGGQVGQGGGGGFNPGSEFPALGQQPSSNPGVQCRNETTGVFGPCTGKKNSSASPFISLPKIENRSRTNKENINVTQTFSRPRYRATIKHRIPGWCE